MQGGGQQPGPPLGGGGGAAFDKQITPTINKQVYSIFLVIDANIHEKMFGANKLV